MKKKLIFIFGTRPEAVKLSPLIDEFKNHKKDFNTIIAVTGQHRQMLDQALGLLNIIPDFDMNLMTNGQSLEDLTSKMISLTTKIIQKVNPDLVFVQGDTTSTFCGALCAFYQQIPVAHIEAGLRTDNLYSPFPEEINRRMTSAIASLHYAPTESSKNNLLREGYSEKKILVTGNTVVDSLFKISNRLDNLTQDQEAKILARIGTNISNKKIILVTGHRRENFGEGLNNICSALKKIAQSNNVQIIFAVHLNPNVQKQVTEILKNIRNVDLVPPIDYEAFIYLMKKTYIVLTDSGGIQEEVPSMGIPVLVLRDTTERPEGIEAGTTKLIGTNESKIVSSVEKLLINEDEYKKMTSSTNPYGDGKASGRIYEDICKYFFSTKN